jgi:hypothetical protein
MMPEQGSLFPFATPQTALACCRRIEAMVLTVGPEMTRAQCHRMQCELSIPTLLLEQACPAAKVPPRPINATPETVLLYCRDLGKQIVTAAPTMSRGDCVRILEELVQVAAAMEAISEAIRLGPEWQLRHMLPALPEPKPDRHVEADRLDAARHWRAPVKPIAYQPTEFVPGRGLPNWRRGQRDRAGVDSPS